MTFPVNSIIVSTTVIRPVDGVEPTSVSLIYTDPTGTDYPVSVTLTSRGDGTWSYRGFIRPTVTGTWVRTWSALSLITDDVADLVVV